MLNAEEARARLAAIERPGWRDDTAKRVRTLRRRSRRAVATAFLDPEPPWTQDSERAFEQRLWDAGRALDEMSVRDRLAVCSALHPGMGDPIARWWVDAWSQPYPAGYARRAFRAPHRPAATRLKRSRQLHQIVAGLGPYDQDVLWLAAWAPHVGLGHGYGHSAFAADVAGPLLAVAIDTGGAAGDQVLATLVEIGNGEHAIGVMDRHVIVGLLRCSREEGWSFVERLLLAAQRQEGLRQSILEAADEAHPSAFLRLLDVVLEHDLLRFAATVRAAGVWLGLSGDVTEIPAVSDRVGRLRSMLLDPEAAVRAVVDGDPWQTYTALCALAMRDVDPALDLAGQALARSSADIRAATVRFLAATDLVRATEVLAELIDDPDLGVAMLAHEHVRWRWGAADAPLPDLWDRFERLAGRLPERPRTVDGLGIEDSPLALDRTVVVNSMVRGLGERPVGRLLPWLAAMDPYGRRRLAEIAGVQTRLSPDVRATLVSLVGDRSQGVRAAAVEAMGKLRLDPSEAPALEALLTRRAGDLRRGVIRLLAGQPETDLVRSARRLWATGDGPQRDAACELLATTGRSPLVTDTAVAFAADGATDNQRDTLRQVTGAEATPGGDDPAFGLFEPSRRTPGTPPAPRRRAGSFSTDAARRIVSDLDDLAEVHRDTVFTAIHWRGSEEILLADARWLPTPFAPPRDDNPGQELILPELFRGWWADRPADQRDAGEGLDALRAFAVHRATPYGLTPWQLQGSGEWFHPLMRSLVGPSAGEVRHSHVVGHVLSWMVADHADAAVVDECLDALETSLAAVTKAHLAELRRSGRQEHLADDWRRHFGQHQHPWAAVLSGLFAVTPDRFNVAQLARWFGLQQWLDQPVAGAVRRPAAVPLVLRGHRDGLATDDDVYDVLLERRSGALTAWTRRRRGPFVAAHPRAAALADRLRARVLEIESRRGELATAASPLALKLGSVEGAELALELLARLGRATLVRGHLFGNESRDAVYSHLLRVSYPGPEDDPELLRKAAKAKGVKDTRLVDLAVFAPQWTDPVERAIGWDGLAGAVWWYHAHTKDEQWSVEQEVRETWAALSAERTPLSAADLMAGAVDVEWFHRARSGLGDERWKVLHRAAKLASGGAGHRRAQLYAEAMQGDLDEAALLERIRAKRHQDSVRALGLLPLPSAEADPRAVTLARYQAIREWERGSKKFGSQRRASEANAARIGIENLARTAGFADPQRFVWAMESAEAGDLADGPVSVTEDGVTVTLSVDGEGAPRIVVRRGEKSLASVPAKLRKAPGIAELRERKTALTRQATRVRASLEAAMVRMDAFADEDFAGLRRHPVVAPMLELMVFVDESGRTVRRRGAGFLDPGGDPVTPSGRLRVAHPVDLVAAGWVAWQERLFTDAQRQPFKQVFRELYTLTETERAAGPASHRWEGHQIQPGQAMGLFGQRGWLVDREGGEVSRVFHAHDTVARVGFVDGFGTPGDVELPTIQTVHFTKRGEYLAQPIDQVHPIVFSEAMRDLDLVVSVAHAGGVDPEASASTVEMRTALVLETVRLLRLDNVRLVGSHAVIEGALGEYSVHLGSATVHRRPGGALCIIPIDAQRRGRIFLPFADADPKTAEVIAKVLMLARDTTIKDPTILSQLRS